MSAVVVNAHREPGVGQVGGGIVQAPLACFEQGLASLVEGMEAT